MRHYNWLVPLDPLCNKFIMKYTGYNVVTVNLCRQRSVSPHQYTYWECLRCWFTASITSLVSLPTPQNFRHIFQIDYEASKSIDPITILALASACTTITSQVVFLLELSALATMKSIQEHNPTEFALVTQKTKGFEVLLKAGPQDSASIQLPYHVLHSQNRAS